MSVPATTLLRNLAATIVRECNKSDPDLRTLLRVIDQNARLAAAELEYEREPETSNTHHLQRKG